MRGLKRIFYDGELRGVIELPEEESHKLKVVLRSYIGEKIEILSNDNLAQGEIALVGKRSVQVRIDSVRAANKPNYSFTVYQCITKREYMDFMVEKYAELGVTNIIPVISSRSLNIFKNNTMERFRSIIRDAALQSENEFIANVSDAIDISKIKAIHGDNILFHERIGEKSIPRLKSRDVGIVIGPEGGFSDHETKMLVDAGFLTYTPLSSILKAETASILFAGIIRIGLQ